MNLALFCKLLVTYILYAAYFSQNHQIVNAAARYSFSSSFRYTRYSYYYRYSYSPSYWSRHYYFYIPKYTNGTTDVVSIEVSSIIPIISIFCLFILFCYIVAIKIVRRFNLNRDDHNF